MLSAAVDRPTRLEAAENVLRGAAIDDALLAKAGDAAVAEVEIATDLRGSAAYKKHLLRVHLGPRRPHTAGGSARMTAAIGSNIGKSLPRLEARDKVTGRTEYTHHLRLPGMLYGKILRSTVPHGRIKQHRHGGCARARRRVRGRDDRGHPQGHPEPLLRPRLPRPADPGRRQGAVRRRAGRRRARRRQARRGGGARSHPCRIR